jgi:hypothetical protein
MEEIETDLAQIKSSLENLSHKVVRYEIPQSILRDFKLALDHLRLTIWAVIMAEEEDAMRADGLQFGLATKLVEFRIKRLLQMLADLQTDLTSGAISPAHPELHELDAALLETRKRLSEYFGKVGK